jgi:hypothetical protein
MPKQVTKEQEVMQFLSERVFDPILHSPDASQSLKKGVRRTITRMNRLKATGMLKYYWSSVIGTQRSPGFAEKIHHEGFKRFEEVIDEFRTRFTDEWLNE